MGFENAFDMSLDEERALRMSEEILGEVFSPAAGSSPGSLDLSCSAINFSQFSHQYAQPMMPQFGANAEV